MVHDLTYAKLNTLELWQRMRTITLSEMRSVKLMNRIDTKYVLSYSEVLQLLEEAANSDYFVQIIDGVRACRYETLYYDTADREMFIVHHNRKLTRQKLRTRTYIESGISFFEIKNKSNRGRTKKHRTEIDAQAFSSFASSREATELLAQYSHYTTDDVSPALTTHFTRITLVNPTLTERITIDLELCYEDVRSHTKGSIEEMAIVEIKSDGNVESRTKRMLCNMRVPKLKVSKYCLGTTLTVNGIKCNRFKAKVQRIRKRLNR
ncbi:MAG: polyphosphate polymerase domain-containing protein [Alistipes sp.]|nr:polyphosphate polymerase domain-containing protein [Alistipes sp.]